MEKVALQKQITALLEELAILPLNDIYYEELQFKLDNLIYQRDKASA